ncbi:MAG: hypothetical protein HIU91_11170 [Acidobacteria bacterium]|nr:hypothetical protein [Acidobacteriota bacterium]
MHRTLTTLASAAIACLLLSGCHVTQNGEGGKKNVDIGTPFGSLKVNTDNTTDPSSIGLEAYPGATPVADSGDNDANAANVNMSFGSFHLGVKAASFQTPDPQAKVIAFYRKDLTQHFGDVIECRGDKAIGTPTHTSEGLTCNSTRDKHYVQLGSDNGDTHLELLTGSDRHQHIVTVEDHGGGTKIGLVALDLPTHLSGHDDKDSE